MIESLAVSLGIEIIKSDDGELYLSVDNCSTINKKMFTEKFPRVNETFYLTVGTQKGGVGKTTISYQLGLLLSLLGYKTLFVDFDAQSNLTSLFNETIEESEFSLYDYFCENKEIKDLITKINPSLSLLPANTNVGEINSILEESSRESEEELSGLKKHLSNTNNHFNSKLFVQFRKDLELAANDYDFVIFDTHPETNFLNRLALQVSNLCLVPMEPTKFSKSSLRKVVPEIRESLLISDTEYKDKNVRVLLNFTRPVKSLAEKEKKIKEMNRAFGKVLLENHINFHYEITEATDMSYPVWAYPETTVDAILDIKKIVFELLDFISREHSKDVEDQTSRGPRKRTLGW